MVSDAAGLKNMPEQGQQERRISRRSFTAGACTCLVTGVRLAADCLAEDQLHVLGSGNIERLRMDFNASRTKVRLFCVLSPT